MLFSRDMSVGNRILDSEHKKLHDIINEITNSIAAGNVAALSAAFELLENGLCAYFVVEEGIAQALDFDFNQHKLAHQNLLQKFLYAKDGLMANNGGWSKSEKKDYIVYLRGCLVRHIKEDDKPFKIALSAQFYDFKPG